MPKTLWVQANPTKTNIRKVILSEADPSHPTPNHELWIVAYEDPRFDADGNPVEPANPPIRVGDTPGVRAALQAGDLIEADAPRQAHREPEKPEQPPQKPEKPEK
jgi:hypothetical protein